MNKLESAQRFAEIMLEHLYRNGSTIDSKEISEKAFILADAMQAEADKREVSIEETMKDHVHDYIYGRVCACGKVKDVEEEWQPDWSQAPTDAYEWLMVGADSFLWRILEDGKILHLKAPSFNYQGHQKDSLRKRPQ